MSKEIEGYDGQYLIYPDGRVWTNPQALPGRNGKMRNCRGKFLKQHAQNGGYMLVQLYKNGKNKNLTVHRLVAEHFVVKPVDMDVVNHIDNSRDNNNYTNLEWTNTSGNLRHAVVQGRMRGARAMTREKVEAVREELRVGNIPQCEIADMFGISTAAVSRIKNGKSYKF